MSNVKFLPENSAQGTKTKPNPFVKKTLEILVNERDYGLDSKIKIVDLGCGKLRHLNVYLPFTKEVLLVDTKHQIERLQKFAGVYNTMQGYIKTLRTKSKIRIATIEDFETHKTDADVVMNVAVMDAILHRSRIQVVKSAHRNLKTRGYFVVIVPRNDASVTVNCTHRNIYQDGYRISRKGSHYSTFYINFGNPTGLFKMISNQGFALIKDYSNYRNLCCIFQKQ